MRDSDRGACFFPAAEVRVVGKAEDDLHDGRAGGGEADVEQAHVRQAGHEERHRDAHAERAEDALCHDEDRLAEAGEIAHEAEQERGQQTVDGVGLEIVRSLEDDGAVIGALSHRACTCPQVSKTPSTYP